MQESAQRPASGDAETASTTALDSPHTWLETLAESFVVEICHGDASPSSSGEHADRADEHLQSTTWWARLM